MAGVDKDGDGKIYLHEFIDAMEKLVNWDDEHKLDTRNFKYLWIKSLKKLNEAKHNKWYIKY